MDSLYNQQKVSIMKSLKTFLRNNISIVSIFYGTELYLIILQAFFCPSQLEIQFTRISLI